MENNKIQKRKEIILLLIIVLLVISIAGVIFGVTYAWYTRIQQERIELPLSNPVEIYITEDTSTSGGGGIVTPEDTILFPGSKINLNLGFVMGKPNKVSSPAYVRVKLNISAKDLEGDSTIVEGNDLVTFNTTPDASNWVEVEFEDGKWWVFCLKDASNNTTARVAQNGEIHTFINGTITISTSITNELANKKIDVNYVVSAIQEMNVENPILDINNPTWGKQKID